MIGQLAGVLCFAAAAMLGLWVFLVWRGVSQDWLPADLKAGRLVAIEEDLIVDAPYPVVGRPDQVYALANGLHVPLELKNRDKDTVYDTDIAEISLRAWLLRLNGKPTAEHGYMVVNNRSTGRRRAIRVELKGDDFCERLVERHIAVTGAAVSPRRSRGGKCRSCGHSSRCT